MARSFVKGDGVLRNPRKSVQFRGTVSILNE